MYCDNIYVDYDNYSTLEEEFSTSSAFATIIANKLSTYQFQWLTDDSADLNKIKGLILSLSYPIYVEYHSDKIGYLDSDTFVDRVINSVSRKINKWYIQHMIDKDLLKKASLENFISNGGTHSDTKENASTGSAVIQKSASTPTGITHSASSEDIDVELSHNDTSDITSLEVTDGYEDKELMIETFKKYF